MKKFKAELKWWMIKHIIIPSLITDDQLTPTQTEIFKLYFDLDKDDSVTDWRTRKLVSYLLYRALPIYILVSLMGKSVQIKTKVDLINLKTIIGNDFYKNYFMKNIDSTWIREKWYNKNKLPIIARINNENYVVDGNHRLAQQILRNEIQYNYIEVNGGWLSLYLKYRIGI